jgi:hypothetical protein
MSNAYLIYTYVRVEAVLTTAVPKVGGHYACHYS